MLTGFSSYTLKNNCDCFILALIQSSFTSKMSGIVCTSSLRRPLNSRPSVRPDRGSKRGGSLFKCNSSSEKKQVKVFVIVKSLK